MDAFSFWVDGNWFNLIQTSGILGGLWLTAAAANREAKAREIQNLLTLEEHHHVLWQGVAQRKELTRVFQVDANMLSPPPTVSEREFLNSVIVHFQTGWWIARSGGIINLTELRRDAWSFFSLPLPRAVWEETKEVRNRQFVKFVEQAMSKDLSYNPNRKGN